MNFGSDKAGLTAAAKKVLDRTVAAIVAHGFTKVELVGHTDSNGNLSRNTKLANSRAYAVDRYLSVKLKQAGVTITKSGKAYTAPVANNTTEIGKATNRRVEIVIQRK